MSHLDKLTLVAQFARLFVGELQYRRHLAHIVKILLLTVIMGMLGGGLLLGGLYALYLGLVAYGLGVIEALLAVGGLLLALLMICVALTLRCVQQFKNDLLPAPALDIQSIFQAFLDGFQGK